MTHATISSADLAARDTAALAALTADQREALDRLAYAKRLNHFRGGSTSDNLRWLHERDAAIWNEHHLEAVPMPPLPVAANAPALALAA